MSVKLCKRFRHASDGKMGERWQDCFGALLELGVVIHVGMSDALEYPVRFRRVGMREQGEELEEEEEVICLLNCYKI